MGTGPVNDPPPTGPGRGLMDKYDLADRWGVPAGTVVKMITKRDCPRIIWIGRHARFNLADVEAYEAENKEKPAKVKPAEPALALVPPPAKGVAA